ncbi:MAG: UDPGP type 1 family protein [Candidatus Abyssobacteria bacterium SURF_17]|uniref:UDPGP type 1 family protein n=1 Tax=Candidatus Abyssobacteria bacterium SURF_17 TaxID=2093361 RepID=A0A419ETX4_9BACT|nr:MAG: UDPGP type 1 family protein [Candidatus Abyssubacteria bacterium SURF_17]
MREPKHPDPEKQKIIEEAVRSGQGHVFRWWHEMGEQGKERLLKQLQAIAFRELGELYNQWKGAATPVSEQKIEPAEIISIPKTQEEISKAQRAVHRGEEAIRAGKIAAFVVAGGQATRLGIEAPKGTLKITPVREKTIFEHHSEKILALSARHKTRIPLYVMTSETNDGATREFFELNRYFGLDPSDVFVFKQEMMPALDFKGKLVLDAKDHIFTSPNGHGGSITSLKRAGALADMQARGIEYIFYFQVDNVLIKMADPLFLGHHIERGAEMSAKVAPKRDPEEKVGVVCRVGNATTVIEYSDLPDDYKYARNPDGSLTFSAGNLAIHVLSVDFVERLNTEKHSLPFHIAEKIIPFLDDNGSLVKPKKKNGLKFEKFVFDALSRARATSILEVDRDEEFAPIKNETGEDSPDTARDLMMRLSAKWLEKAGARVPRDSNGRVKGMLEISPLFALDAAMLKAKLPADFEVRFPLYLGPE